MRADTIAAPATAPGEAGLAVIRISGPDAVAIASTVFDRPLRDRRVVLGRIVDQTTDETVDEAIGILMRGPRSYTREDVVELHCHGGPLTSRRVMHLLTGRGARTAEPGEFTLRAFLNGRIDLAQAESVLDLIRARTDAAQRVAMLGVRGRIGSAVGEIRSTLLSALAYLVARIDFPDEDVPMEDIAPALVRARAALERLLAGSEAGRLYRDGARVALIGPPNAGKSSLLNRLVGEDRAIVTPIAGTTRDTIEEAANLGGVPVVFVDTAGLAEAIDPIEALGMKRARQSAAAADAVLLVLDRSARLPRAFDDLLSLAGERPSLAVLNKSDLPGVIAPADLPIRTLEISATRGDGVDLLESELSALLVRRPPMGAAEVLIANGRHQDALRRASECVGAATQGLAGGLAEDFISIDIRGALDALGEITGETATEDLLDTIFSRFCIGK
jgi:tRNA modification GTPase